MRGSGTQTWHYGLIAAWWAEKSEGGDDLAWFQRVIEDSGQPALDLGCGAGRLLVPFLRAGLDVDGCDVSEDMLQHAREKAFRCGFEPQLFCSAMAELELPRRYRTIVICGSFGIGGDRAQDLEALRRIREHLEPGGTLAFDHYLPFGEPRGWSSWLPNRRPKLPSPWPEHGERKRAADGTEYELKMRVLEFNPLEQYVVREVRAEHWRDGELIAQEDHSIRLNIYFKNELLALLELAGFGSVDVRGGLTDKPARPYDDTYLTFLARA